MITYLHIDCDILITRYRLKNLLQSLSHEFNYTI